MRGRLLLPLFIVLLVFACKRGPEERTTDTGATIVTEAPPLAATTPTAPTQTTAAPAATPPGGALAVQETNFSGVTAEVTEFRRKGNTLTAKVRYTNRGSADAEPDISYGEAYLIDTGAGKKYQVLRDEKGAYIAGLKPGWTYRWYDRLKPGERGLIWMKFPAPPPEVKVITLQIPSVPPFEDVPIQD